MAKYANSGEWASAHPVQAAFYVIGVGLSYSIPALLFSESKAMPFIVFGIALAGGVVAYLLWRPGGALQRYEQRWTAEQVRKDADPQRPEGGRLRSDG